MIYNFVRNMGRNTVCSGLRNSPSVKGAIKFTESDKLNGLMASQRSKNFIEHLQCKQHLCSLVFIARQRNYVTDPGLCAVCFRTRKSV